MNHKIESGRRGRRPRPTTARLAALVEMGFTHDEAKGALRITDPGDGLRVNRVVEYLLRR